MDQYTDLLIPRCQANPECDDMAGLIEFRDRALARRFFDGDHVSNYEVGLKTTLFDGRARVMAAAYYLDWEDMIIVENDPLLGARNPLSQFNSNSGGAEISGFELEVSAFLTERLSLRFAGDVNETEVQTGPANAYTSAALNSSEGNELSHAPGYSASLAVDYVFPIMTNWNLTLHADHAWVDGHFSNAGNTADLAVPKWTKANASVTARSDDGKWRIALFGSNITNEEILRDLVAPDNMFWHMPRQIGLEVGYSMN